MKELIIDIPVKIRIIPCPEGGFFVEAPGVEGWFSQGETEEECIMMLKDAAGQMMEMTEEIRTEKRKSFAKEMNELIYRTRPELKSPHAE